MEITKEYRNNGIFDVHAQKVDTGGGRETENLFGVALSTYVKRQLTVL